MPNTLGDGNETCGMFSLHFRRGGEVWAITFFA